MHKIKRVVLQQALFTYLDIFKTLTVESLKETVSHWNVFFINHAIVTKVANNWGARLI